MEKTAGPASVQSYIFRHLSALAATSMLAAFLLFGAILPLAEAVAGKASFTSVKDGTTIHALPESDNGLTSSVPVSHDTKAARFRHSYNEIQEAIRRQENTEEHSRVCAGDQSAWFIANAVAEFRQRTGDHIASSSANNQRQSRAPPAFAM